MSTRERLVHAIAPAVTRAMEAWDTRAARERRLLALAGALTVGLLGLATARAALDDLATLRARVAGRERELAQVRRLAARLERLPAAVPGEAGEAPSLTTRLEAVATETLGHDRIAGMVPAGVPADPGAGGERVALRVAGASLAELVRLLHALEAGPPPLAVARLELRKHPDDPARFDATVEVARPARGPAS